MKYIYKDILICEFSSVGQPFIPNVGLSKGHNLNAKLVTLLVKMEKYTLIKTKYESEIKIDEKRRNKSIKRLPIPT